MVNCTLVLHRNSSYRHCGKIRPAKANIFIWVEAKKARLQGEVATGRFG